jgi:hypothetical protein
MKMQVRMKTKHQKSNLNQDVSQYHSLLVTLTVKEALCDLSSDINLILLSSARKMEWFEIENSSTLFTLVDGSCKKVCLESG